MSASPNVQAIICEEVFDESSHPSLEEINEYATKIGIDPKNEPHLLHLAKEGLMQALPAPWKPCYDEKSKSYYYYNGQTGRTQWEHPLDDIYRSMVTKVRSGSQASFDEDSKAHEENTYTKEDLQSFEESVPKPPTLTKPLLSPLRKLEPINLGARKKDVKLSPVKIKSKSMQDFGQKSNEFLTDNSVFGRRRGSRTSVFDDLDVGNDKAIDSNKSFLLKNDKHPNSIEKGELTLSGGGSMFLKSNTKKLLTQTQSDSVLTDTNKSIDTEQLPKSILRDRSLPETHIPKDPTPKDPTDTNNKKIENPDDDRKIVRFNLETQDVDIDFTFSDSEQKSTESDEEIEVFVEPKSKPESVAKSRFTVSPVFDDDYRNAFIKRTESLFDKIDNANKLEELPTLRNTNLKLIKPNPTDFITPKLIAKPLETVKSTSILSDSEDESVAKYKTVYPKDDVIITEKTHIQDTIPEEDKSLDASSDRKDVVDTASSPIHVQDVTTLIINNKQIENNLDEYTKKLEKTNEEQIKECEKLFQLKKEKEMEKLRQEIKDEQERELKNYAMKEKEKHDENIKEKLREVQEELEEKYENALKEEEEKFEEKLKRDKIEIEKNYERKLEIIESSFKEKEKEIESNFQMSLKQTEAEFLLKLEERIKEISIAHKAVIDRMKDDHNITLEELLRDFKSEEEIVRREHYQSLSELKDKLVQDLEVEKHRMRENGEDRLYEKVRCEKRLLEDKYRCLKEKYLRLKTDVKVSLEKRNRRKEQSLTTTTGSDTERSTSHKKTGPDRLHVNSHDIKIKNAEHQNGTPKHLTKPTNKADINSNRSKGENKNIRQITIEDIDTSMSDRSSKRNDNDDKKDNNDTSDGMENPGRSRRKLFTRLKSSSTSRLNNNPGKNKEVKRSCSPVENLRRQLQKLEDLEDQFPQAAHADTYHLRYPFSDAGAKLYYMKYRYY